MLGSGSARRLPMVDNVGSLIRLCAIVASGIVALSLLLFVIEQSTASTANQVRMVDGQSALAQPSDINRPDPGPVAERVRERVHSPAREKIDDADDLLLSPFTGIVGGRNVWAARLVPAALAFLLYGLGGMMLANFATGGARETRDWRESHV